MALPPGLLESLSEGTEEERLDKLTAFVASIRAGQTAFTVPAEDLERWEAALRRCRETQKKIVAAETKARARRNKEAATNRALDEFLIREQGTPVIPLFGKRKKDSH